jgi:GSH-dependent disulfide-bond oxidoreductase
MIDLFFATSTNVYKILIALEEMEQSYSLQLIDISKGEQLDPANLAGSPTQKLPVIRDNAPADGGEPLVIFESGAILQYLADKTGMLLPKEPRSRLAAIQWLFWQVGGLGPISGQAWHFHAFAPRIAPDFDNSYSTSRYYNMMSALWRVLDGQLGKTPYLAGEYSIADIACYPWIIYFAAQKGIDAYPNIVRWRDAIAARPGVQRAYARIAEVKTGYEFNEEKKVAFYPWEDVLKNMITT